MQLLGKTKTIILFNSRVTAEKFAKIAQKKYSIAELYGRAGPKGLIKQKEAISKFKTTVENLVCTRVAEQGLDLPAAKLLILYEPLRETMRMVQRFGRIGRAGGGKVVLLYYKDTFETSLAQKVEKQITTIKKICYGS